MIAIHISKGIVTVFTYVIATTNTKLVQFYDKKNEFYVCLDYEEIRILKLFHFFFFQKFDKLWMFA